jgi:hypothetical protein
MNLGSTTNVKWINSQTKYGEVILQILKRTTGRLVAVIFKATKKRRSQGNNFSKFYSWLSIFPLLYL